MLTDLACRQAKAKEQPYKLTDGKGLYLFVTPSGFRSWRMKYRCPAGKEKTLTFGAYPEISLGEAREKRDEARALLRDGIDPSIHRKQRAAAARVEAAATFERQAEEWMQREAGRWTPIYAKNVKQSLEDHVYPHIGSLPVKAVTAPLVLDIIRRIEREGKNETARRVRSRISTIFASAIAAGLADNDPAAPVQKLMTPARKGQFPAVTRIEDARALLTAAESIPASPVTKLASRLLALTVVRPGVLRTTPWTEWEKQQLLRPMPLWHLSAMRMKLRLDRKLQERFDFLVPLARQSIEIIEVLRELTGRAPMAFPNDRWAHKPMSENAIGYLYNRTAFRGRHVPHGWRSTFSTIMNERAQLLGLYGDRAIIDLMLGHLPDDIEATYNRAAYLPRRAELAQEWADTLLEGLPPARELLKGPRN
ncbi:MAG TPA: integrase arm-type DNA-binding domain-containing protein [Allosphingosinicella sp.]|uniref:tyrosine-type recombinase/integrase n=1 Tax=Allosphingosinicella sp. TaxID=2823234 RepID=UPI002ED907A3